METGRRREIVRNVGLRFGNLIRFPALQSMNSGGIVRRPELALLVFRPKLRQGFLLRDSPYASLAYICNIQGAKLARLPSRLRNLNVLIVRAGGRRGPALLAPSLGPQHAQHGDLVARLKLGAAQAVLPRF